MVQGASRAARQAAFRSGVHVLALLVVRQPDTSGQRYGGSRLQSNRGLSMVPFPGSAGGESVAGGYHNRWPSPSRAGHPAHINWARESVTYAAHLRPGGALYKYTWTPKFLPS